MDKGLVEINCDLCGGESFLTEFEKDGLSGVRCAACGLVFVNPQPAAEYLKNEVYSEDYFSAAKGYGIEDMFGTGRVEHRDRAAKLFSRLEKTMKPGAVLDIGCAAGFILEVARERGWKVKGIEISDFAAAHAREKLGIAVETGDFTEMNVPDSQYDLILMLDVLEHFRSPKKALEKARQALRKGGRLIIATPNYDSAPARALGPRWGLVAPEHHLYYFTPTTIRRYFKDTGFGIVSMEFPIWGLSELLLSAGSFQKAGIPVSDGGKKFVNKHLRAPRDFARSMVTLIDRAVLTPIYRKKTGAQIFLIAEKI